MTREAATLGSDASPVPALLLANVLPVKLLKRIQADAGQIAKCPNFWTTREDIEAGNCSTAAEEAVRHLYHTCLQGRLPQSWAGAEWWVQSYEGGRGLAFHFDKDEHAMKARHEMITPIFSSVFYLTGSSDDLRQSPTVIVNQRYNHEEQYAYPEHPDHSTLVFPAANCYCLFDGGLGHGVLDCGHDEVRTTFLVNWWAQQPEAVHPVTKGDILKFQLTRAGASSSPGREALTAVEVECSTTNDGEAAPTSGGSSSRNGSNDGSSSCGCADGACCGAGMAQGLAPEVHVPSITVSEQEVEDDGFLTLDDLLQDRGLAVSGQGAVPGIALSHPGLVLFPLEGSQLRASGGEVQIGAALVPLASLPEDSSCSSSSGSEDDEGERVAGLRDGEGSGAAAV